MPVFTLRPASPDDNDALLDLCRIPVSGAVQLALEREPDYFAGAAVQAEEPEIYVAIHSSGRLAGMFNVGYRTVFLDRQPTRLRYFCDLRIHPDFQRSRLLFEMMHFCLTNGIINDEELAQTVIFSDNLPMLAHLDLSKRKNTTRRLAHLYQLIGEYHTYLVKLPAKIRSKPTENWEIRRATTADLAAMQRYLDSEERCYQGFPCYNFNKLAETNYYRNLAIGDFYLAFEKDELVGIAGIWDQKAFKQTRITGYDRLLTFMRPIVNAFAGAAGSFALPEVGKVLSYFSLHTILIKEENPQILLALLGEISSDAAGKNFDYFLCGLRGDSPLTKACLSFKTTRLIKGNYYLVSGNHDLPAKYLALPFYLEGARI